MAKKVNYTADKISKVIIDCSIVLKDMEKLQQHIYDNWKPENLYIVRNIALMGEEIRHYIPLLEDYKAEVEKNGC